VLSSVKLTIGTIVGIGVSTSCCFVCCLCCICRVLGSKKKERTENHPNADDSGQSSAAQPNSQIPSNPSQRQSWNPYMGVATLQAEDMKLITNNFRQRIGRGASADVYTGQWTQLTVAVKRYKENGSARNMTPLQHMNYERNTILNLNHPNVVKLLAFSRDEQCPCLVFPHFNLGSLERVFLSADKLFINDWRVRLQLGADVADALHYLHTLKPIAIVHRDVKLANILISSGPPRLQAVLCDFDAAKEFAYGATVVMQTTTVIGSHGYIDPNYANSQQLSKYSDIFGLGVVLLQLLTGDGWAYDEVQGDLHSRMIEPLKNGRGFEVSERDIWAKESALALGWLIHRCLERKPADRLSSCGQISTFLNQIVNDECPPGSSVTPTAPRYRECGICLEKPANSKFNPCNHSCACERCAEQQFNTPNPLCPICRSRISGFVVGDFQSTFVTS